MNHLQQKFILQLYCYSRGLAGVSTFRTGTYSVPWHSGPLGGHSPKSHTLELLVFQYLCDKNSMADLMLEQLYTTTFYLSTQISGLSKSIKQSQQPNHVQFLVTHRSPNQCGDWCPIHGMVRQPTMVSPFVNNSHSASGKYKEL